MQLISNRLKKDLARETSSLCYCWEIIRRDGSRVGLTDHNEDITLDEVIFFADAGMRLSRIENRAGFSEHGLDIEGVLSHPLLSARDLETGIYDKAHFIIWLVNWRAPENKLRLLAGGFGEVSHDGTIFRVGVKSSSAALNKDIGQIYQRQCPAQLGDAHCRVDLASADHSVSTVVLVARQEVVTTAALDLPSGWFSGGLLNSNGVAGAIKDDQTIDGARRIILWDVVPGGLLAGEPVTLIAGCDHRAQTCKDKFSNLINFQGFPFLPEREILINIDRNNGS